MLGLPWLDYPSNYDTDEYTSSFRGSVQSTWADLLAELQGKYPEVTILDVPYGLTVVELRILYTEGNVPDVSAMTGDPEDALFTDQKGHAGDIVVDTASVFWLNRIYTINLPPCAGSISGYETDICLVAEAVYEAYDAGSVCGMDACYTSSPRPPSPPPPRRLRFTIAAALVAAIASAASSASPPPPWSH